jgi:hypothetical protein
LKHLKNLRKPTVQQELRPGETEIHVSADSSSSSEEESKTAVLKVSESTMKIIEELKKEKLLTSPPVVPQKITLKKEIFIIGLMKVKMVKIQKL